MDDTVSIPCTYQHSHSYAVLTVSPATYAEIRARLLAVEYGHCIKANMGSGEVLDLYGLALQAEVPGEEVSPCPGL